MRSILLVSVLVCALAPAASAEPLNVRAVPVGADLVAHLDLAALRAHSLYPKFVGVAKSQIKRDAVARIAEGLLKRISGVTVWMDGGKEQIGMLVNGVDPKEMLALLALAPKHKLETKSGREVHSMETNKGQTLYAIIGKQTLHAATDLKRLFSGVDTFEGKGKAARIDKGDIPNTGAFLFVAVLEQKLLEKAQKQAASTLVKLGALKNLILAIAQQGKDTLVRVSARLESEAEAKRVQEMLQGLLALGSLGVEDEKSKRLVSSVSSQALAKTVEVSVKLTDQDILDLINEVQEAE